MDDGYASLLKIALMIGNATALIAAIAAMRLARRAKRMASEVIASRRASAALLASNSLARSQSSISSRLGESGVEPK